MGSSFDSSDLFGTLRLASRSSIAANSRIVCTSEAVARELRSLSAGT